MNILEAIKAGRKVQTRDGRSVRVLCTDLDKAGYPLVVAIKLNKGEEVYYYTDTGHLNIHLNDPLDLVLKPIKVKKWFNIYKEAFSGRIDHSCFNYDSEEEAKNAGTQHSDYLCTKYYEIEI